jgi:hypothetical protein
MKTTYFVDGTPMDYLVLIYVIHVWNSEASLKICIKLHGLPLKIKIFLWLVQMNKILTIDNLKKMIVR